MNKLSQLRQAVNEVQLDVAYLSDPMTIKYLTGFGSDPIERVLALLVFADHDPFLFAPALEVEAIKDTGWPTQIKLMGHIVTHLRLDMLPGKEAG